MGYAGRGWAWMVACALALAGCAAPGPLKTYEGAARPLAEVALVSVPEQIEVMAIDGREPPPNFLRSKMQLALLPGEHVFSLRYVELFQLNADEHDVIRSRQAALRFDARAGGRYRLEIPRQPNRDAARQFAKAPQFRLVDEAGGAATESVPVKSFAEASLIDTLTKAFEAKDEAARPPTNVDLLQDIWRRSSPEEQAAFRRWLEQQDGAVAP